MKFVRIGWSGLIILLVLGRTPADARFPSEQQVVHSEVARAFPRKDFPELYKYRKGKTFYRGVKVPLDKVSPIEKFLDFKKGVDPDQAQRFRIIKNLLAPGVEVSLGNKPKYLHQNSREEKWAKNIIKDGGYGALFIYQNMLRTGMSHFGNRVTISITDRIKTARLYTERLHSGDPILNLPVLFRFKPDPAIHPVASGGQWESALIAKPRHLAIESFLLVPRKGKNRRPVAYRIVNAEGLARFAKNWRGVATIELEKKYGNFPETYLGTDGMSSTFLDGQKIITNLMVSDITKLLQAGVLVRDSLFDPKKRH